MKVLLCVALVLAAGCQGIRCERIVRHSVDDMGRRTIVTEWHEQYGWALKPPKGWQPEAAMTPPVIIEDGEDALGAMPLLPFDGMPRF